MTSDEAAALLIAAMDRQGMTDNDLRAGTAAIAMGESLMTPHTETPYTHTDNSRIRQVFGSRVSGMSDTQLNIVKANPVAFFNTVYGGAWGAKNLGNTEDGDGYKYRGRTMLQLTGRVNYAELAKRIGVDIVANPDLANDPQNSAAIAVAYMLWRYKGGGFERMLAAVGNNTADIRATKVQYYGQFTASGQFDFKGGVGGAAAGVEPPAAPPSAPIGSGTDDITATIRTLQAQLGVTADGVWGPKSQAALLAWQRAA